MFLSLIIVVAYANLRSSTTENDVVNVQVMRDDCVEGNGKSASDHCSWFTVLRSIHYVLLRNLHGKTFNLAARVRYGQNQIYKYLTRYSNFLSQGLKFTGVT